MMDTNREIPKSCGVRIANGGNVKSVKLVTIFSVRLVKINHAEKISFALTARGEANEID